ncbi:helix-turn-helix domain-containing protein [Paraburkholderia sediminicola]|uniref:helix-turn-helix domain-containing protein n=1 Tax=Paraburkholderia sediminicola TaxID=458836 RepID=UPI0038BA677D
MVALDLITTAVLDRTNQLCIHGTLHRTAQFQQAKKFIDDHLAHPDISSADVAAALGVSTRYVRDLLAEGGLSYRQYLLKQRLKRCALDLVDPRLAHRTIAEVAYSWAFSDNTHFSRAFKQEYGMSPRDYRARTQPG